MSRLYQFDDEALQEILALAYRHGFSHGYSYADWDVKLPPSKEAQAMARKEIDSPVAMCQCELTEPKLPFQVRELEW